MAVFKQYTSLVDKIPPNNNTKDINTMWVSTYPILKELYTTIAEPMKVTPMEAQKYKGDLAGLFASKGINVQFILPNILANGFNSSESYDGQVTEFIRLSEVHLHRLLIMTIRTSRLNHRG